MVDEIKAVGQKFVGYVISTFLAGFTGELLLGPSDEFVEYVATGGRTALVGGVVGIVLPFIQRKASKAAATELPRP